MSLKSFYEMLPEEIVKAREISGCAFIPVGPIEWHSYHLPMGTDALISEKICELVAEKVNGIYFKPLFLGVDSFRNEDELLKLGFKKDDKIFGMNFPELELVSEYCNKEDLISNIERRLKFLKDCGFKTAFVINHHGGLGQVDCLQEICNKFNSSEFNSEFVYSFRFFTLEDKMLKVEYGGHAGISETNWILAFYPGLVDLSKVNRGELNVRENGFYHWGPVIEEKYNPRHASKVLADELRENIISNFVDYIKKKYL